MNLLHSSSDFKNLVGNIAVVTTILQFLSGVLVCRQYVVSKTTGDASPLPFLCGVLSAGLWLLYGATKNDEKIVFVNAIGFTLMISYVIVFYKYSFKKYSLLKQVSGCVIFGLFVLGYVKYENDSERLLSMLGLSACYLTLMTVAAPLSKLFHVIKVKNTECLPFPMILMSFFVSALWLEYGYLESDIFMTTPNFIGVLLALSQLVLFLIYPSRSVPSSSAKSLIA